MNNSLTGGRCLPVWFICSAAFSLYVISISTDTPSPFYDSSIYQTLPVPAMNISASALSTYRWMHQPVHAMCIGEAFLHKICLPQPYHERSGISQWPWSYWSCVLSLPQVWRKMERRFQNVSWKNDSSIYGKLPRLQCWSGRKKSLSDLTQLKYEHYRI